MSRHLRYEALERRYEGAIPPGEILLLRHGSVREAQLHYARQDVAGWRLLIREWIAEVIRPRRADRSIQPYQEETLRQYLAEYRRCQRRLREIEGA